MSFNAFERALTKSRQQVNILLQFGRINRIILGVVLHGAVLHGAVRVLPLRVLP